MTHGQQKIPGMESRQVGNAARIDIVEILKCGTPRRGLELHQRRGRLCTAQNKSEASLGAVKKLKNTNAGYQRFGNLRTEGGAYVD